MIYVVRYLLVVLYTILWGIPACIVPLFDRSGEAVIWIGRQWVRWIFWTCGIRVEAEGLENVDPQRPFVLMSNHQSVLDALDKTLIPSAQNAELKDLLVKTRPAFVDHLNHAKKLQASLGGAGAPSGAH